MARPPRMMVKLSHERKVRSLAKKTLGSTRVGRDMRFPIFPEGKRGEGGLVGWRKGGGGEERKEKGKAYRAGLEGGVEMTFFLVAIEFCF